MKKKTVYTIATAHLDTVWSWDFETTVREYLPRTLKDNFALFQKYPEYKFNFEGAYRYELMREYYPDLWEKMKEYIALGRWNVCGSAFENGDVNIPSPEALFRNILLGNQYFYKNFGVRSCDIFLPDCFGFGYALPSVMRHANLKGFTTQKLSWGSAYGVPFDTGKWYGVDGNYVYASIKLGPYDASLDKVRSNKFIEKKLAENEGHSLPLTAVFHGTGDRGGSPKEASVKAVCNEVRKNSESDIQVLSAPADRIYKDIDSLSDDIKQKLPVWNNELVMSNHAVGGYTSRAVGKRWNRRNEELADMAERACSAAFILNGREYPTDTLNRAWKRVIAHQFHDDLPGTSVQRAYRRSWNDYAMSMNQFAGEYEAAVKSIVSRLDTSFAKGIAVAVCNPMEYERSSPVEIRIPARLRKSNMTAFDSEGRECPTQIIKVTAEYTALLVYVTVPPMGCKILDIKSVKPKLTQKLKASVTALENEKYKVGFNSNGDISSIFDKRLNKEILKKPIITGIFDYKGSTAWPAWELNFKELNREPQHKTKVKSVDIAENGACRVALKIVKTYGDSTFTSYVALSLGGEVVEVYNETEWRSLCSACKEIFSFTAENHNATYDLGLGAIKRGNMDEKLYEVPAQKWADISDSQKGFGVSVISECKYGWDKFDDSTLRLTLMHTPLKNYRIDSMQSMLETGLNRYSYAIFSHSGEVAHETQCAARDFIMPLTSFICSSHSGDMGSEFSFGSLSGGAVLRAVKKAEDSGEIVVRIGESEKKKQNGVKLSLFCPILSAREIYASEEEKGAADVTDGELVFDLDEYEIKSFALTLARDKAQSENQLSVCLPENITAVSPNIRPEGALPVIEKTIPAELMPESVYTGGVRFTMPKNGKAVLCGGQTVILPPGTDRLHLLAASLNGDKTVKIGARAVKINDIREYYAGWDLYDFGETAYTKDGNLGFEFTHSHTQRGDAPCEQLFFWKITVSTKNMTSVTLPVDRDIIILAATADGDSDDCRAACEMYDKIKDRKFTYKMNVKDKIGYIFGKEYFMLNDKGGAFSMRNAGKKKTNN